MPRIRIAPLLRGLGLVGLVAAGVFAAPVEASAYGYHYGPPRGYYPPPGVYYRPPPPPVYYRAPVYSYRPPVYYAPRPFVRPGIGLSFNFR